MHIQIDIIVFRNFKQFLVQYFSPISPFSQPNGSQPGRVSHPTKGCIKCVEAFSGGDGRAVITTLK